DDAGVQVDPADPGAVLLGDEQVALVVAGDAPGLVEVGAGRGATVTVVVTDEVGTEGLVGVGRRHVTGDGRDVPVLDHPDEVVPAVGEVDRAVVGHPDALGVAQRCGQGGVAV